MVKVRYYLSSRPGISKGAANLEGDVIDQPHRPLRGRHHPSGAGQPDHPVSGQDRFVNKLELTIPEGREDA
ncbi:MAG: hypothetical protein IID14_09670 [Candidatus Marinimicrobia bacterium]|nr:hypothetical protein [Candidatus Neomarinimicrobiota bacterium]